MIMQTETTPSANLKIWNRLQHLPLGKWMFSRAVCLKAPYFRTIHPAIEELRPGYCRVTAPNRRGVHNHLGTFHAIASCNMAELAGGMMTDATIPSTHRWIPVGMTVEYKAQARTAVTAIAHLDSIPEFGSEPIDLTVPVDVSDESGNIFVTARITMRITPRR
ncbi:hotdog fold domain-containing protein [Mycolicibacterium sp. D5.8-2]|nr:MULTISPECIES: hotdog fold domain-containing protein [Mycolicibacterium]MDW5609410.1 hotdog fold domain-containing protein [Mycolicibacterium sp. D5.8-2]